MRKLLSVFAVLLLLVSCGKKEDSGLEELRQSQIEPLQESSELNIEMIEYEGEYKGEIKGKKIDLKIESESFEITENGRHAFGNWMKVNDGTIIELNPKSGTVDTRFYSWSDKDSWMALTDSLTIPDVEEFLKRITDQ